MPPHIFLPFCPAETHFSQQIKTNQLMPSSVISFEIDYWHRSCSRRPMITIHPSMDLSMILGHSAKITDWTVGPASYTKCSSVHQILKIGSFNSAGWTVRDVPDVSNFPLFVRLPADVKSRILQCTDKCNETTRPAADFMPHVNFFLIIVVTHIPRMALF